jgi:hypothetical protein
MMRFRSDALSVERAIAEPQNFCARAIAGFRPKRSHLEAQLSFSRDAMALAKAKLQVRLAAIGAVRKSLVERCDGGAVKDFACLQVLDWLKRRLIGFAFRHCSNPLRRFAAAYSV